MPFSLSVRVTSVLASTIVTYSRRVQSSVLTIGNDALENDPVVGVDRLRTRLERHCVTFQASRAPLELFISAVL